MSLSYEPDAVWPRIDRLVAEVVDGVARVRMLAGTPTEGATLRNLWGMAPLPEGVVDIPWRFLIAPGQVTTAAEIQDRRPWAATEERRADDD